jgi:hypothetical protein
MGILMAPAIVRWVYGAEATFSNVKGGGARPP